MANHVSALKRARQNEQQRLRNRAGKAANRTAVRKFLVAVEKGEGTAALPVVASHLAKSASKGTIPKKRAARKTSRLAKLLNKQG